VPNQPNYLGAGRSSVPNSTTTTSAAAAVRTEPVAASGQPATIGSAMRIKGHIRTPDDLRVDGEIEGSVESHSLVTVGPSGKVDANIKAREVIIFGTVRGNLEVTGKIAVRDQGSLVGNIKTAGISIDDGAYFKGKIDILMPQPKPAKSEAQAWAGTSAAGQGG
jgi:cytoskeletal protein CcmA (bactofilin family)